MILWGSKYGQSAMQHFELSSNFLLFEELYVWVHPGHLLGPYITFQIYENPVELLKGLVKIYQLVIYLSLYSAFKLFFLATFDSYYKFLISMCFISIYAIRNFLISEAKSLS